MGKLAISQELSDKISNSLRIKHSEILDTGANKPIIRKIGSPPRQQTPKYSPIKNKDASRQPSPRDSSIKKRPEYLKHQAPRDSPIAHPKKSNKSKKPDKLNYLKISKIVFISSIVGGIGITLGIKLGTILFL